MCFLPSVLFIPIQLALLLSSNPWVLDKAAGRFVAARSLQTLSLSLQYLYSPAKPPKPANVFFPNSF